MAKSDLEIGMALNGKGKVSLRKFSYLTGVAYLSCTKRIAPLLKLGLITRSGVKGSFRYTISQKQFDRIVAESKGKKFSMTENEFEYWDNVGFNMLNKKLAIGA